MKTLTALFGFFLLAILSCNSSEKELTKSLAGNWLLLYPDHRLTTMHQRKVYAKYQDSLLSLYGLKLITLAANGGFKEMDSLQKPPGKWMVTKDSLLKIREGGKGFNPFNTAFTSLQDSVLLLTQYLPLEDEKIKVIWHLKKVEEGDSAAALFSREANAWRQHPAAPEPDKAIKRRLAAILNYYATYFAFIGKEAIYFSPVRVPLPLHYYQHGIGLKSETSPAFVRLFYNEEQAATAYGFLKQAITVYEGDFSWGGNFSQEYGAFLKKLALWLNRDGLQ